MINKIILAAMSAIFFCSLGYAEEDYYVWGYFIHPEYGPFDEYRLVHPQTRNTELIGLSTASCADPTESTTIIEGFGKLLCQINAIDIAIAGKMSNPVGTPDGSKFLRDDGSWQSLPSSSVTSVACGSGLSGGTITSSGTCYMPNTGTPGTYYGLNGAAIDAQGRVTAVYAEACNDNVSRSLNSSYTISSTKPATVSYSVNASWSLNALLTGSGAAYLEYSTNAGSSWTTVNQVSKGLNLLTFAGSDDMNVVGKVPANALVRIRTASTNMTVSYVRGQECY